MMKKLFTRLAKLLNAITGARIVGKNVLEEYIFSCLAKRPRIMGDNTVKLKKNQQLASQLRRLCKKHGIISTVEMQTGSDSPHLAIIDYNDSEEGTILRFYNASDVLAYLGY